MRSGGKPNADQPFFQRVLHALDTTPRDLAREFAVHHEDGTRSMQEQREISATLRRWARTPAPQLSDVDRDELWFEVEKYVDQQLGYLLAVKHELNVLLQKQRTARAGQRTRLQALGGASAPSSLVRRTPYGQRR